MWASDGQTTPRAVFDTFPPTKATVLTRCWCMVRKSDIWWPVKCINATLNSFVQNCEHPIEMNQLVQPANEWQLGRRVIQRVPIMTNPIGKQNYLLRSHWTCASLPALSHATPNGAVVSHTLALHLLKPQLVEPITSLEPETNTAGTFVSIPPLNWDFTKPQLYVQLCTVFNFFYFLLLWNFVTSARNAHSQKFCIPLIVNKTGMQKILDHS